MYLITSAAYITQELRNEIGQLPPAFLPVRNQRLFVHQLKSINLNEEVYLSIPNDYLIEDFDQQLLDFFNVKIIKVPIGLSLGQSVNYALDEIHIKSGYLKILHGDTLILDIPQDTYDFVIASDIQDDYDWSRVMDSYSNNLYYSGYFSLANLEFFKNCLNANSNFIESIDKYIELNNTKIINSNNWFDFGHINTYYRSRAYMPNLRHFNSMETDGVKITKYSKAKNNKIIAEAKWYQDLPQALKYYTPLLLDFNNNNDKAKYDLEYLYLLCLNEIFVYGKQPSYKWKQIFQSCKKFLTDCEKFKPNCYQKYFNNEIYLDKTLIRLELFLKENPSYDKVLSYDGYKVASLKEMAVNSSKYIQTPDEELINIVHGDFCFSNILFDFRKQSIKVIDPRGHDNNEIFDIYGDNRYDYSKLAHSIIGLYDLIIAEKYHLIDNDFNYHIDFPDVYDLNSIQDLFWEIFVLNDSVEKRDVKFIYASMIQLFISMLPLHSDSKKRQNAIIANSLRLYLKLYEL